MEYGGFLEVLVIAGVLVFGCAESQSIPDSPCPNVFQYKRNFLGTWYGIITVPNPYPYLAIELSTAIYITAPVPKNTKAKLQLVDKNAWKKLYAGDRNPVKYRLDFPLSSPLPLIKEIKANQETLCTGTKPSIGSQNPTTLSFQQSIFNEKCTSSSLECPYNKLPFFIPPLKEEIKPREHSTSSFQNNIYSEKCTSASLECPPDNIQVAQPVQPIEKPPSIQPVRQPQKITSTTRTTTRPQTPLPTKKPIPSIQSGAECGRPVVKANPLTFYGTDVLRGQWPWHAALYHLNGSHTNYICGGSFVGYRSILTAAHCVTSNGMAREPREYRVHLGRYDLTNRKEAGTQEFDVKAIFVHPTYQSNYTKLQGDVALLQLSKIVSITDFVRPICLWDRDVRLSSVIRREGVVVGWGLDENNKKAEKLRMVKMPIVDQQTCLWSNREFFPLYTSETTLCAGFANGTGVCNGDSGGGLVLNEMQRDGSVRWLLRAIVSNSKPRDYVSRLCDTKHYIIFTDIAKHLDWITTVLI